MTINSIADSELLRVRYLWIIVCYLLELCTVLDLLAQQVDSVDDEHDGASGAEEKAHDR